MAVNASSRSLSVFFFISILSVTVLPIYGHLSSESRENLILVTEPGGANTTKGSERSDIIVGNSIVNIVNGKDADDVIMGRQGNDELYGSIGNDILQGNSGADIL